VAWQVVYNDTDWWHSTQRWTLTALCCGQTNSGIAKTESFSLFTHLAVVAIFGNQYIDHSGVGEINLQTLAQQVRTTISA
jgi:hypothetical protein